MLAALVLATELAGLQTALAKLTATTSIHAAIEVTRSRHSKGRFLNDDFQGIATANVDEDAGTLHVTFPRALLDRTDEGTVNVLNEMIAPGFPHPEMPDLYAIAYRNSQEQGRRSLDFRPSR